jgi:RNA-directed DNA polymerase
MIINTVKHLAYILKVRQEEFSPIINNIDKYYYEKNELKFNKDGSPKLDKQGNQRKRTLRPGVGRLKEIQDRIQKRILSKIKLPDYAYGGVKERDNVKNARRHQGRKFIFTTDLKNYYPSINHHMVYEMFRSHDFSPAVARILTQLTTYKGQLPQGTNTSTALSNLVFAKTGKKLDSISETNHLKFTSFIDDLTFSSPKDFKCIVPSIIDILSEDDYRISHQKTNYKTKNPIVTGIKVKNNSITITDEFKYKLANSVGKSFDHRKGLQLYVQKIANTNSTKPYLNKL